jgi:murE/murF fusion protein
VFVACPGRTSDGRHYIADAVANGAGAVVYEGVLSPTAHDAFGDVPAFAVSALRQQLGALASAWWAHPSSALTIIAVTGTNGKTTTAQWLAAALQTGGVRCGVIGTLGVTGVDGRRQDGWLTTPDALSVHQSLAQLLEQGATHVVMEASSIGLDQGRLDGVQIDVGVYTNLTQDHLDYHGDMNTYAQAKARLFAREELKHAVINLDDAHASLMMPSPAASVLTYAVDNQAADLQATDVRQGPSTLAFTLQDQDQSVLIQTPFVGAHVVANLLAVAGVLRVLGWSLDAVAGALQQLPPVPGRLELVHPVLQRPSLPAVVVDYAHTPDALQNALHALAPLAHARAGRLWCVVGCGGDRDRQKRPLMAQVAQSHADQVVLTSDNPRREDPDVILQQMMAGLAGPSHDTVSVAIDRARAILATVWQAEPNDVILVAGKGHESYQEVDGKRYPFDDRQWCTLALLLTDAPPDVQTDSRQLNAGALFVALRGQRFDGHDYLEAARDAGAVAAIVEHVDASVSLPQITLGPTLTALQTLARAWRERFEIPVIGVTGSNGKTTTKEMIAAICREAVGADATLSTVGNLNNDIGVPLTLMRLRSSHQVAVIEMGMNHPGEIALLAAMAKPTVGLVLNAQREHQEFMKSVESVAQENGQVLCALPTNGVAVYPGADAYSEMWARLSQQAQTRLTFGTAPEAHLHIDHVSGDGAGSCFTLCHQNERVEVSLQMAGQHNVMNAAAAAACAVAAGFSLTNVAQALSRFAPVKGRMQVHRLPANEVLIDDTYNANPDSVRAAIDVLAQLPAPRALVLGDMGEVGDQGPQMHAEVGHYAREQAIDHVWAMGQATHDTIAAFGSHGQWFETASALCEHACRVRPRSMLVKGSRFMAMENIVNQWLSLHPRPDQAGGEHAR